MRKVGVIGRNKYIVEKNEPSIPSIFHKIITVLKNILYINNFSSEILIY